MATKKTKAKPKKKTPTKIEELRALPEAKPGDYTLVMTSNEVFSLIQILGICRDIFKQMSLNCAIEGDIKGEAAYSARSEASDILFSKIRQIASIGEPTSRALH